MNNSPFVILTTKGLNPSLREEDYKTSTNEVGEIGEAHISRVVEEGDISACDLQGVTVEHPEGKIAFEFKIKNEPFKSTKVMKQVIKKKEDPMAMLKGNDSEEKSDELLKDLNADSAMPAAPISHQNVPLEEMEYKKKSKLKEYMDLNINNQLFNIAYDGSQCLSKEKADEVKNFSCEDKIDPGQHFDINQTSTVRVFQGIKSLIIKCGEC